MKCKPSGWGTVTDRDRLNAAMKRADSISAEQHQREQELRQHLRAERFRHEVEEHQLAMPEQTVGVDLRGYVNDNPKRPRRTLSWLK